MLYLPQPLTLQHWAVCQQDRQPPGDCGLLECDLSQLKLLLPGLQTHMIYKEQTNLQNISNLCDYLKYCINSSLLHLAITARSTKNTLTAHIVFTKEKIPCQSKVSSLVCLPLCSSLRLSFSGVNLTEGSSQPDNAFHQFRAPSQTLFQRGLCKPRCRGSLGLWSQA